MQATVTLTHSDILTIPTKGFELVPAPGSGKVIVPIAGFVLADFPNAFDAAGYTASSTIELAVRYGASALRVSHYIGGIDWLVPAPISGITPIAFPRAVTGTGDYLNQFYTESGAVLGIEDAALNLYDDDNDGGSDYTGGNAANTLKVTIIYSIVDV